MIPDGTRQTTLVSLLRRTSQLMVAELVERLTAAGYPDVTAAYHPVFESLDREGTRLTELAARAEMTHQSMGELIDTLEQRGYVVRRPDPADRRARLVCLTSKGRQMLRIALREIADIEANWTQAWKAAGLRSDLPTALEHGLARAKTPPTPPAPRHRSTAKTAVAATPKRQ